MGAVDGEDATSIANLIGDPCEPGYYFRGINGIGNKICNIDESVSVDAGAVAEVIPGDGINVTGTTNPLVSVNTTYLNDVYVNEGQADSITANMITGIGACSNICDDEDNNTTNCTSCDDRFVNEGQADSITADMITGISACSSICTDSNTTNCSSCDGNFVNEEQEDSITSDMIDDGTITANNLSSAITTGACSNICNDDNSGGTITGVTAGTGLSGGGTSGTVSLSLAGETDIEINPQAATAQYSVSEGHITLATYEDVPLMITSSRNQTEYLFIGADLPGKLFGVQQYITSVSICYKVEGSCLIDETRVFRNTGTSYGAVLSDLNNKTSETATCYEITGSPPYQAVDGAFSIRIDPSFSDYTTEAVYIFRITAHLSSSST